MSSVAANIFRGYLVEEENRCGSDHRGIIRRTVHKKCTVHNVPKKTIQVYDSLYNFVNHSLFEELLRMLVERIEM
jgi:hypothetical protein